MVFTLIFAIRHFIRRLSNLKIIQHRTYRYPEYELLTRSFSLKFLMNAKKKNANCISNLTFGFGNILSHQQEIKIYKNVTV